MVEIIPKPVVRAPLWADILLYFSIVLVVIALASFFILINMQKKGAEELSSLNEALKAKQAAREPLEKEVLREQKTINDFSKIVAERLTPLNFFSFLQGITHPKVAFSQLDLNPKEAKAGLLGSAESFEALDQQILIFEKQKQIRDVRLSNISIDKQGGASFSISLSMDPQLFR